MFFLNAFFLNKIIIYLYLLIYFQSRYQGLLLCMRWVDLLNIQNQLLLFRGWK